MPRLSASKQPTPLVTINTSAAEPEPEAKPPVQQEEKAPMWFWDLLESKPRDQWGKVYDVWIMRLGDSKVPMLPGEKGYLDQFMEPINPAFIKQKYGGGKYRCVLRKNGRFETSHDFDIEGQPMYDFRRERPNVPPPANGDAAALAQQFISVLREELHRSRESGNGDVDDKTIEMLSKASDKAMEMITSRVPTAVDPTKQLESLVTVGKSLGIFGGAPAGGGIIDTIRVLKELGLVGQAAPNPMEQLTTFLTLFDKLDALRGEGGGNGRRRDWKEIAVEKGLELAPRLLDEVAARREQAQQPQRPLAVGARQVPAAAAQAAPSPQFAPQGAAVSPAAPVRSAGPLRTVPLNGNGDVIDMPPEPQAAAPATAAIDEQSPAFVDWIKRRVVALVQIGQGGESIVDFLDGALPGFSDQLVQAPAETVTGFMAMDPILSAVTQNPRWPQILEEARAYILDEEAEPAGSTAKVQ